MDMDDGLIPVRCSMAWHSCVLRLRNEAVRLSVKVGSVDLGFTFERACVVQKRRNRVKAACSKRLVMMDILEQSQGM